MSYAKHVRETQKRKRTYRVREVRNDRKEDYLREQNNVKKSEYVNKIQQLIESKCIDDRRAGKCCPHCKKVFIGFDLLRNPHHTYETYAGHRVVENMIKWASTCIACKALMRKRTSPHTALFDNLCSNIARHRNGTREDMKKTLYFIRTRDMKRCKACNVEVVSEQKSGWRQESINDMRPNELNDDKTTKLENLAISCLCCNMVQNKLPWVDFINALKIIANTTPQKNHSPLTSSELKWLLQRRSSDDNERCNPEIKFAAYVRDGRHCVLTGAEMVFVSGFWNTVSFDRIDSKLPYTLENTRLVCKHINFAKQRSITEAELQEWLAHIRATFVEPARFFDTIYETHYLKRRKIQE